MRNTGCNSIEPKAPESGMLDKRGWELETEHRGSVYCTITRYGIVVQLRRGPAKISRAILHTHLQRFQTEAY